MRLSLSTSSTAARQSAAVLVPTRPCRRVVVRASGASTAHSKPQMEQKVHKWFESLASDEHPIEDLVTSDAHMTDNINQACYKGFPAMKHRMQSVHESLPNLVEVGDVADTAHNCVAAHWRAGEVTGTYVFKFNGACMIEEVLAYADDEEEEFLEA